MNQFSDWLLIFPSQVFSISFDSWVPDFRAMTTAGYTRDAGGVRPTIAVHCGC